jgi:hypothetical protein
MNEIIKEEETSNHKGIEKNWYDSTLLLILFLLSGILSPVGYYGFIMKAKKTKRIKENQKRIENKNKLNITFSNVSFDCDDYTTGSNDKVNILMKEKSLFFTIGGAGKSKKYVLPDDVSSFASEDSISEKTETKSSTGKAASKIALAALAASAFTKGKGGVGTLAGFAAHSIDSTPTTTTTIVEKVILYIQFKDNSIFSGTLSKSHFEQLKRLYDKYNFKSYGPKMRKTIEAWEKELVDLRDSFSTMDVKQKSNATKTINSYKIVIKNEKNKLEYMEKEAKKIGII